MHLIPAGELRTHDNRGPFKVKPAAKLILNPMTSGDRLSIEENHATDRAGLNRMPAPARGWIVELAPRSVGIWGRVEFTEEGCHLVASKAHQGIFPFNHRRSDNVVFALRRLRWSTGPICAAFTPAPGE
ncbi:hypothetical protein JHL21_00345 [Devosia sp. WQ 349]|uniref:phage protease n=1 Tax=Devosia sp. WQ 349K1 TaxID=2800329 RepID=UPI001905DD55|nr:hypothetical protein [Devosia sp. WQ 349K1]